MVSACVGLRDLRTVVASLFKRGIQIVVMVWQRCGGSRGWGIAYYRARTRGASRRRVQRASRLHASRRIWIAAALASVVLGSGFLEPHFAAAQRLPVTQHAALPIAAAGSSHAAVVPMIGGANVVAQISGLHDQTQRVVLLAPNLDAYTAGELVRGLAIFGVRATSVREARLDPALEACGTFGCLAQVARASQGRAALASLSRSGDGSNMLLLVLVDADGSNAQARTRVGAAGIAEALTAAWKETSLSLALQGESMIHAESRPAGASVWLDGAPAGSTPFARQVSPGSHTLLLKLDGFVGEERTIQAKPGKAERVQLTLRREQRFQAGELTRTTRPLPSAWNSVLGGALVLAAAPALIASLNALANDGQCLQVRETDAVNCSRTAHFGTQSAVLLASGVLVLSTGATLLLAQPIE